MKGITYTSTKTSTNTSNENSQKEATKTNDKPTTMQDRTKNTLQATGAADLLNNFVNTDE